MTYYTTRRAPSGALLPHLSYSPGHPWWYHLGGPVLGPKSILKSVLAKAYTGYRDDIDIVDALSEPKRSEALRNLKAEIDRELANDIARYRQLAGQLRQERALQPSMIPEAVCSEICSNIALKHNHIFNDLAHLRRIENALSVQADLFDLI